MKLNYNSSILLVKNEKQYFSEAPLRQAKAAKTFQVRHMLNCNYCSS